MQTLPGISGGDWGRDDIGCTGQEIRRACLHARLMTVTRVLELLVNPSQQLRDILFSCHLDGCSYRRRVLRQSP